MTNANLTVKKKKSNVGQGCTTVGQLGMVYLICNLLCVSLLTLRIFRCPLDFLKLMDTWYRPAA